MSMDDRPNTSIWGTILSCAEIALNVYSVVAAKGRGIMIPEDEAEMLLSEKARAQGETADGFLHYEENGPSQLAAAYELVKNGHISDPELVEQIGTPEQMEEQGRYRNPEYFGGLPEPEAAPDTWGGAKGWSPIDNGIFYLEGADRSGFAVHKTVVDLAMSGYAQDIGGREGDYHFFDLNHEAAVAVFELSASHPAMLERITSWESLMHTLAESFPDYTDKMNHLSDQDNLIVNFPAPSFMFLQQHLDRAASAPAVEHENTAELETLPDELDEPDGGEQEF